MLNNFFFFLPILYLYLNGSMELTSFCLSSKQCEIFILQSQLMHDSFIATVSDFLFCV